MHPGNLQGILSELLKEDFDDFENPGLLWLLLVIPVFLIVLGVLGWGRKRAIISIFPSVYNSCGKNNWRNIYWPEC